jgi:UDP-N-acetylglucosamine:LPS N-acetylglucosamine transferase
VKHKAAVLIRNEELASGLLPVISTLMKDPKRMASMQKAMTKLATPHAAHNIGDLILNLANTSVRGRS